jgi:tetratricopeptide (TPR) repeat protein
VAEKPADMNMVDVYTVKGIIAAARQDYSSAYNAFASAYKVQANSVNVRRMAESAIRAGKVDEGLKALTEWTSKYPDDWQTRFFLGNQLLGLGRHDAAAAQYEQVLAKRKDDVAALNNLAWLRQKQGRLGDAAKLIERALALIDNDANIYDTAGGIYMAQKRHRDAVAAYRKALDLSPQSGPARERYAQALIADGRKAEARQVLRELLQGPYQVSDRRRLDALYLELAE